MKRDTRSKDDDGLTKDRLENCSVVSHPFAGSTENVGTAIAKFTRTDHVRNVSGIVPISILHALDLFKPSLHFDRTIFSLHPIG